MSQYRYTPLSKSLDSIRLLRLLPSEDQAAEIQVELFEYRLQLSSKTSHPYEALSYSWDDLPGSQSVFIGDKRLNTTSNLHAALLHLRDCGLPRILWIDAICINQADDEEKAHQIQYMVTIYGKASQVAIWLGPSADNSNEALDAIRAAGKEYTDSMIEEGPIEVASRVGKESASSPTQKLVREAVIKLLQRRWFRRVWVLQEVAAARRILIMCGNTEIDSHAFCVGLERFKATKDADSGLRRQVRSLIYLIRQATHRSKLVLSKSGRSSLDICSLGELIDMYHDYGATKRHDKVYAMLGMCTDDLSESGLLPDYRTAWHELMQRLVHHLFGIKVRTNAQSEEEIIHISGKGCVIGLINKIEHVEDSQTVGIQFNRTYGQVVDQYNYWDVTLPATANHVQMGDVVCQLQGAPKPMIVRPCNGYWTLIILMITHKKRLRIKSFPRDFDLVWDWKPLSEWTTLPRQPSLDEVDRASRLWNFGMILQDAGEHSKAEVKVIEAIQILRATSTEAQSNPIADGILTETVQKFGKVVVLPLLEHMWDQIDLPNLWTNIVKRQDEEVVALLLERYPDGCKILTQECGLWFAAQNSNPKVLPLLLNQPNKAEIHITEAVVAAAVANCNTGFEMLSILLQERNDEVKITVKVIQSIRCMSHALFQEPGHKIMRLLLDSKGTETHFTEAMVAQVVKTFDQEVVQLLFAQHKENIEITKTLVIAALENSLYVIELLVILLDHAERKIETTSTLIDKVHRGFEGGQNSIMALFLHLRRSKTDFTESIVTRIMERFHVDKVKLLFDLKGDEIQITEAVVSAAASNVIGAEVLRFLLNRVGNDIRITEGIVEAAASSGYPVHFALLLEHRKDEVKITEAVLQAAIAGCRWNTKHALELVLDFDDSIEISEAIAKAATQHIYPPIDFLLERKRGKIQITDSVLEAAVMNKKVENDVIHSLLDYDVRVTEAALAGAAADEEDAGRFTILLDRRGDEIKITEAVVQAALSNWESGEEVMDILLNRRRDDLLSLAHTTTDDGLRGKLRYWVPKKSRYAFECFTWIPSSSELYEIERNESAKRLGG